MKTIIMKHQKNNETLQTDFMANIYYYIQTLLLPILVLALCLCILKYCCKFCRTDVIQTDSDLSFSDRVFVIPIDERDEPDCEEETDYRPPSYDLVCPPPSYTESGMKIIYVPSGQETLNTWMDASQGLVEMPPPPYSPPLDLMSQTRSHEQQPSDS